MGDKQAELTAILDRQRACTETVTCTLGNAIQRAAGLAGIVALARPDALGVCLLPNQGHFALSVVDPSGLPRPDLEKLLQGQLSQDPFGAGSWPPALELPSYALAVAPISSPERRHGLLALALPRTSRRSSGAAVTLLTILAEHLGRLLQLEEKSSQGRVAAEASQGDRAVSTLADLTNLVGHEFNNFLNSIVLQVAVLEQLGMPEALRPELAVIRQRSVEVAGLVRQLQQYCQDQQPPPGPVDLNRAVGAAVAACGFPVRLELAAGLPPVLGSVADLERLTQLLLTSAAAAAAPALPGITVRTEQVKGRAQVRVTDTGPAVPEELLPRLFEPFLAARPGSDGLSLAVCKAIARRLQGTIRGENQDKGGMAFCVELRWAQA